MTDTQKQTLAAHIIRADRNGNPLAPSTWRSTFFNPLSEPDFNEHIKKIIQALQASKAPEGSDKKKILIHIHGGLNSFSASRQAACDRLPAMRKDDYYPIFINWSSGFTATYLAHLFLIRQGDDLLENTFTYLRLKKLDTHWLQLVIWFLFGIYSLITGAFILFSDIGRGIARFPINATYQLIDLVYTIWLEPDIYPPTDISHCVGNKESKMINFDRSWRFFWLAVATFGLVINIARVIVLLNSDSDFFNAILSWLCLTSALSFNDLYYIIPYALSLKVPAIVLCDGIGKSAWDNMTRRTQTLFRKTAEFQTDRPGYLSEQGYIPPSGAIAQFMRALQTEVNPDRYEITLIAHSMGAIIANDIMRLFPRLPLTNIVYLGAACSIEDFTDAFSGYIRLNPSAEFYNLCLNPVAEKREWNYLDIVPRSSLLEWIDSFYTSPRTVRDRRLGKWDNLRLATHLFNSTYRKKMTFKIFSVGDEDKRFSNYNPQTHSEFTAFDPDKPDKNRFWDPAVWQLPNPDAPKVHKGYKSS